MDMTQAPVVNGLPPKKPKSQRIQVSPVKRTDRQDPIFLEV